MEQTLKELKKYAHLIVESGLVVGAGGNLSMRHGNYMYISPSGYDLKEVENEDWAKVDIETGDVLSEVKPSSEILMHLECYRKRADITSVLHAHPTYSVAVSTTGHDIPSLFPDFPAMVKSVGYLDYLIPTTHVLADAVKELINQHDVIVMRNHGVLTVGRTMKEAYFYMQLTEESAKVYSIAAAIGDVRKLTEAECDDLRNLSAEKFRSELLQKEE